MADETEAERLSSRSESEYVSFNDISATGCAVALHGNNEAAIAPYSASPTLLTVCSDHDATANLFVDSVNIDGSIRCDKKAIPQTDVRSSLNFGQTDRAVRQ